MAKFQVTRSRSRLPSTTGVRQQAPDTAVSQGLQQLGSTVSGIGFQILEEERKNRDTEYLMQANTRYAESLRQLEDENQELLNTNPGEYFDTISNSMDKILKSSIDAAPSDQSRRAIQVQMTNQVNASKANLSKRVMAARQATFTNELTDIVDTETSLVRRDPLSVAQSKQRIGIALENAKRFLSPQQLARASSASKEAVDIAFLKGSIASSPEQVEALIDSGKFDHLGGSTLEALRTSSFKAIEAKEAEVQKLQQQAQDKMVLDLKSRQAKGEDVSAEILEKEVQLGKNFPSMYTSAVEAARKSRESADNRLSIEQSINSNITLDNTNKKTVDAVDDYFRQNIAPDFEQMEEAEQIEVVREFSKRTGIVPQTVLDQNMLVLRAGTPGGKTRAADMITQLVSDNPRAERQFKGKKSELAVASKIKLFRDSGMTAEEAIKAAEVQAFEKSDPNYKAKVKDFNDNSNIFDASNFTQFFRNDPERVPPQMEREFNDLYRSFTVDFELPIDLAEEEAIKRVKASWGVSEVNGEAQYMRNAPEAVYGISGIDDGWITEQLNSDLLGLGINSEESDLVIAPIPDQLTATGQPEYTIGVRDERGFVSPVVQDSGQTVVWKPDFSMSPASDKIQAEVQKTIQSKRDKESFLKRQKLEIQKLRELIGSTDNTREMNNMQREIELLKKEAAKRGVDISEIE